MFQYDPALLPTLTARKALVIIDLQSSLASSLEPAGYIPRVAAVAAAFRASRAGEVVWVRSEPAKSRRPVDHDFVILSPRDPPPDMDDDDDDENADRDADAKPEEKEKDKPDPFPDHPDAFLTSRQHLLRPGADGTSLVLEPGARDSVVTKSHYSAFEGADGARLITLLRTRFATDLYVCGALTNVGVYATALDATRHGFAITLVEDCCGFRDGGLHTSAVRNLVAVAGCEIVTAEEMIAEFGGPGDGEKKKTAGPGSGVSPFRTGTFGNSRGGDGEEVSASDMLQAAFSGMKLSDAKAVVKEVEPEPVEPTRQPASDHDSSSDEVSPETAPSPSEPLCEGDTTIFRNILPSTLEPGIFERLRDEVKWLRMSHQGGEVPRLVCVQGAIADDGSMPVYRHPSDESPPLVAFTPTVQAIRVEVEKALGHPVNHALIQFYRSGNDYISEHSDKTLDIVRGSFIANVSLGAERTMLFREKRGDKKSSAAAQADDNENEGEEAVKVPRKTIRARLPHNSLCRMGLATNERWLHAIKQDKRAGREKDEAELAYDGGRISLTFRRIGTFLDSESTVIWGQGAKGKTRDKAQAVKNGISEEAIAMLRSFGAENHATRFDWEAMYGAGFDVLHMSTSPRFFASGDDVVDLRIKLMLSACGVGYARGSVGVSASSGDGVNEGQSKRRADVKFVDKDGATTTVQGDMAVMLYIESMYMGLCSKNLQPGPMARKLSRFQRALGLLGPWRAAQSSSGGTRKALQALSRELAVFDEWVSEEEAGFVAGNGETIADFALWPVLHEAAGACGGSEAFYEILGQLKLDGLATYFERFARLKFVVRLLESVSGREADS